MVLQARPAQARIDPACSEGWMCGFAHECIFEFGEVAMNPEAILPQKLF